MALLLLSAWCGPPCCCQLAQPWQRRQCSSRLPPITFCEDSSGKGSSLSRNDVLKRVDELLGAGNEREALDLAASCGLRGFGTASQVPLRQYTIADLRLNNIEPSAFLSPVDLTLGEVRRNLQIAAVLGSFALLQTLHPSQFQVLSAFLALIFISGVDLVINNGGMESLILDTIGRILSRKYRDRVANHEAGHFLIAYLLGVLPKSYTLSGLDAYLKEGSFNVQAGTTFVDLEFQEEVKSGKLSSKTLNKYTCIALAGVATEYLLFGLAEGGLADVQQLDKYENIGQKYWRLLLAKKDSTANFWPRLTKDKARLHWLQTDFDHWKDEDESDDEKGGFNGNFQNMFGGGMGDMPDMPDMEGEDSDDEDADGENEPPAESSPIETDEKNEKVDASSTKVGEQEQSN